MSNEAQALLNTFLDRLQRNARVRKALAIALLLVLLGIVAYFIYDIIPRSYRQTITGGDILSNRHFLAKVLQEEAARNGVALEIRPTQGTQEALALVADGKLDFAFIQGGLDLPNPNVVHVATVAPELLHFLVRPDINAIADLRAKRVNMGSKRGGTRIIAKEVLEFSGLTESIDYVEANIGTEELLAMRPEDLPEAIVLTSFAPSFLADFIVKKYGYKLLEIPFPASLSMRLGWVADSKMLAFMYNVSPPVPASDIKMVGVNLHLVANKNVETRAVFQVLESLYNPDLSIRMKIRIDEGDILTAAAYPLAEGTKMFMDRKTPFFSNATLDKIKSLFGLVLSIASTLLVVFRWFRGAPPPEEKPPTDDALFLDYLKQVSEVEASINNGGAAVSPALIAECETRLSTIKADAMACLDKATFTNPLLPQHLLMAVADTRTRLLQLREQAS